MQKLWIGMILFVLACGPLRAQSNGWGDLDALLLGSLAPNQTVESAFWLPDHTDPTIARYALGFVYPVIEGSAGSVGLVVGIFHRAQGRWQFQRAVNGVYGFSPRDVLYLGDRIEVTTTTLGPGEPRCCPTQVSRYSILRTTGEVTKIQ